MDVQAAPPTYTPAGSVQPPSGNPPVLGQQVPGFSGGLPAQAGLSVLNNPMAGELTSTPPQPQQQTNNVNPNTEPNQAAPNAHPYPAPPQYAGGGAVQKAEQVRQMGRGEDSVLMHVTPHELKGLQALAMAHGGSLTINPHTGLPEAGFLGSLFKKLLPTLAGFGLNFIPGIGPLAAAGIVAAGSTAATGSLSKGLMAGLQAYGGASLSGAVSPGATGTIAKTATAAVPSVGTNLPSYSSLVTGVPGSAAATAGTTAAKTGLGGLFQRFGQAATQGLPGGTPGFITKAAPMLAGMGLMQGVSGALTPSGVMTPTGRVDNSYGGPYTSGIREVTYPSVSPIVSRDSSENLYFRNSIPEVYNVQGELVQPGVLTPRGTPILQQLLNPKAKKGEPMYLNQYVPYMGGVDTGYAEGGEVELSDGAFVLDARTVSELGNGSSNAGKDLLRRIGGRPIEGPGDGVSDSIPARIGRDQPARVARDEVVVPADAVKRIGKGNQKRGADKLYALMDKAHKARKKAKRGQDTGLRRGLA